MSGAGEPRECVLCGPLTAAMLEERSSPSQYHNNPLMPVETSISWSVQRKRDIFCVGFAMRQWTHSRSWEPHRTLLAPSKELIACDQEQLHQNHSSSSYPEDQLALPSTEKGLRDLAFPSHQPTNTTLKGPGIHCYISGLDRDSRQSPLVLKLNLERPCWKIPRTQGGCGYKSSDLSSRTD